MAERRFDAPTRAGAAGPGDACYLREGIYRERLRPTRSEKSDQPITFKAYQDEMPQTET